MKISRAQIEKMIEDESVNGVDSIGNHAGCARTTYEEYDAFKAGAKTMLEPLLIMSEALEFYADMQRRVASGLIVRKKFPKEAHAEKALIKAAALLGIDNSPECYCNEEWCSFCLKRMEG